MSPTPPSGRFLSDNAPWLGAGALLTFTSAYGQTFFIAVFSGEIRAAYGLSHGDWGALYALGTMVSAVIMVWLGTFADRVSVQRLATLVLLSLAAACLAMAALPGVWALPVVILGLRLAGQGMCGHVAITAMTRWFRAQRGRAVATASMGFSLAEATLPILFVALLTVAPWRSLWVLAAMLTLAALVLLRWLLRGDRQPQGLSVGEALPGRLADRAWTRAEALRHPLFWCVVPVLLMPAAFMTAVFFHQVHLAEARGLAHLQFVALLPLYTGATVTAVLGAGWLVDRVGAHRLIGLIHLPLVAGFALLWGGQSYGSLAVALVLMGLGQGGTNTVPAAYWAEMYGTAHVGAIKALAASGMVLGSALGPVITGRLIDAGAALPTQALAIAGCFVITSAVATMATRWALRQEAPT